MAEEIFFVAPDRTTPVPVKIRYETFEDDRPRSVVSDKYGRVRFQEPLNMIKTITATPKTSHWRAFVSDPQPEETYICVPIDSREQSWWRREIAGDVSYPADRIRIGVIDHHFAEASDLPFINYTKLRSNGLEIPSGHGRRVVSFISADLSDAGGGLCHNADISFCDCASSSDEGERLPFYRTVDAIAGFRH